MFDLFWKWMDMAFGGIVLEEPTETDHDKAKRILMKNGFSTYEHMEQTMLDAGLDVLGAGCYGIVINNGHGQALKYCRADDIGYRMFLDIAQNYESPYLPQIFWTEEFGDGLLAIAMERLEGFCEVYYAEPNSDASIDFDATIALLEEDFLVPVNAELAETIALLRVHFDALNENYETMITPDIGETNCMLRGDQLVITDPWC